MYPGFLPRSFLFFDPGMDENGGGYVYVTEVHAFGADLKRGGNVSGRGHFSVFDIGYICVLVVHSSVPLTG